MQPTCVNCDSPTTGSQNFCPHCGQKAAVHRLSLHEILHEAIHYFTHADKGIFPLLKTLALKPGLVQREYVLGKRKKHFAPLNFFLIVATTFVLISSLPGTAKDTSTLLSSRRLKIEAMEPGPEKTRLLTMVDRTERSSFFMKKYGNIVAMAAVPLLSLLFYLFYRKGPYNYTEHLVCNMYINGFSVLCYALLFLPLAKIFNLKEFNLLLILFLVFEVAYRSVSYYHFIGNYTGKAMVKSIVLSITGIVMWVLISFTVIGLYIERGSFF